MERWFDAIGFIGTEAKDEEVAAMPWLDASGEGARSTESDTTAPLLMKKAFSLRCTSAHTQSS